VSAEGGNPERITTLGAETPDVTHRWPQVLPGGNAILYTAHDRVGDYQYARIVAQKLPSGPPTVVQRDGYYGRYVESGHLLYIHDGKLFAVPFDPRRLSTTGESRAVVSDVHSDSTLAGAQFDSRTKGRRST
jgi:serine/threonine-protein kinase